MVAVVCDRWNYLGVGNDLKRPMDILRVFLIGFLMISSARGDCLALPSHWFRSFILDDQGAKPEKERWEKEWDELYAWMKAESADSEFMLHADNFPVTGELYIQGWFKTGKRWEGFEVLQRISA